MVPFSVKTYFKYMLEDDTWGGQYNVVLDYQYVGG